MNYEIGFTKEAFHDLISILIYVGMDNGKPELAMRWVQRIMDSIRRIGEDPERYPLEPSSHWSELKLRYMDASGFRIYYWIGLHGNEILIVGLFYMEDELTQLMKEPPHYA